MSHEDKQKSKKSKKSQNNIDEVNLMSKKYFFKIVGPNLPPQIHQSTPTSLETSEISLLRTCTQICHNSYVKPSKAVWPKELGPPVFYSKYSSVTKIPFFINNSDSLNTIFLTCRGSYCFDDLVTDLMGNAIEVCGGQMHQGFYDTAMYVFYHSQNILKNLSAQNNNRPIIFTGHSLGAVVASAICELMKQTVGNLNCRCICLAPPPSVDMGFYRITTESTKSFILEGDCVPFLSLENVINISVEILPGDINRVVHKIIHKYLKKSSRGAYNPSEWVHLFPPGELYLFHINESGTLELDRVQPEYFDRLVSGLIDTQHCMSNYYSIIMNYFKNHT